jgi:Effector Associated Constant Component 1
VGQAIVVRVTEEGAGPERMDELVLDLQADLRQLDLDEVRRAPVGPPPPGSRGGAVASLTELILTTAGTAGVASAVTQMVVAWVQRGGSRKAEVTVGTKSIALEGASREQQERLIDTFLRSLEEP